MPSGLEILQETIETCKAVGEGLGSVEGASSDWESALAEIAERLDGIAGSFFFKTMPSIPASRACQRDAVSLAELRNGGDWSAFPQGLEKLRKSVETLAQKATMKGTVLT